MLFPNGFGRRGVVRGEPPSGFPLFFLNEDLMGDVNWFNFFFVLVLLLVVLRYAMKTDRAGLIMCTVLYTLSFFFIHCLKQLTYHG